MFFNNIIFSAFGRNAHGRKKLYPFLPAAGERQRRFFIVKHHIIVKICTITLFVDLKKDEHTDSSNRYSPVYDENGEFYSANVLEFIVDEDQLHSMVTTLGTVSYYNEFEGNIVSIEKIN